MNDAKRFGTGMVYLFSLTEEKMVKDQKLGSKTRKSFSKIKEVLEMLATVQTSDDENVCCPVCGRPMVKE